MSKVENQQQKFENHPNFGKISRKLFMVIRRCGDKILIFDGNSVRILYCFGIKLNIQFYDCSMENDYLNQVQDNLFFSNL